MRKYKRPAFPNRRVCNFLQDDLRNILCSCALLRDVNVSHQELRGEYHAAARRVKGNRSSKTPITWDDLRLFSAAILRLCLEKLGEPVDVPR